VQVVLVYLQRFWRRSLSNAGFEKSQVREWSGRVCCVQMMMCQSELALRRLSLKSLTCVLVISRHKISSSNPPSFISTVDILLSLLIGGIASCTASDSAYSCTFLHSVVCLSVVCHTRAPCLNRWMDLDAIWQVHLWDLTTHCVRWGSLTSQVKAETWGRTPSQHMHLLWFNINTHVYLISQLRHC